MINKVCYKTSHDMKRLKKLLDSGYEVVCFYTYDFNAQDRGQEDYYPMMTTDICIAKYYQAGEYSSYIIGSRGHIFIEYWTENFDYNYTFLELLENRHIEFIEPTIVKE